MLMSWRMSKEMDAWQRDVPRPRRDNSTAETDEEFDEEMRVWQAAYDFKVKKLRQREVDDARFRAQMKAIHDAEAADLRQKIQRGEETLPELDEIMKKLRNRGGNGGSIHGHYFVTVNAKPDVILSELVKKVRKYVGRKFVKSVEYVYEQRGSHDGERGRGMHVHMLVQQVGSKMDGEFKRDTRNTFKDLVGNAATHVDIRPVNVAHVDDKREYMRGVKTGDGKAEKVAQDRVWRRENNLEDYYTHENGTSHAQEHQEAVEPQDAEDHSSVSSDVAEHSVCQADSPVGDVRHDGEWRMGIVSAELQDESDPEFHRVPIVVRQLSDQCGQADVYTVLG